MTPQNIFLFDFAIYKKCLLNEKTDLFGNPQTSFEPFLSVI